MLHKVIYSNKSLRSIHELMGYITEFAGAYSATNVLNDINSSINLLAYMPYMGTKGQIEGTRELYPRKYRVVYYVDESKQEIVILDILHPRRLYPPFA